MKKCKKDVVYSEGVLRKKFNFKLLFLLAFNTILVSSVYYTFMRYSFFNYVMISYMIILTALILGFVIYNRGFSRRGITVEMLPDTMSPEEKVEFIASAEERLKKSKWLLTIIIPFLFTFLLDACSWFVEDYILNIFK